MDPTLADIADADIHVRNGEIVEVGANLPISGVLELDGSNMIALPGFIDTHFHLWSCVLRASNESYFPLTLRLGPIYTPQDTYASTRLCVAESLLSGVTTVHDWSHNAVSPAHADASVRALRETGIRARFSYGWGQGLAPDHPMNMADIERLKNQSFAAPGLISLGVAMRTPVAYQRGNVPIDVLREDWFKARELGLPITIHNRPGAVSLLEENDLLGPDVLLVHPQAFTPKEIEILASRKVKVSAAAWGENRRGPNGARGPVQFDELLSSGVPVGLSVDEVVTNGRVDYFAVMREVPRIYMQRYQDEKSIAYRSVLEMATLGGAGAMQMSDQIGSLAPGKRADIVLVRTTDINIAPIVGDPSSNLVLSAQPNNVDTVIVDGKILVRNGELTMLEDMAIVGEAIDALLDLNARDPSLNDARAD